MRSLFADYKDHCEAICSLLDSSCDVRIIFFKAEAGCGKTQLMRFARESAPAHVLPILISLKFTPKLSEFYSKVCNELSSSSISEVIDRLAQMAARGKIQINENRQIGINQHISVILNVESIVDRHERQTFLTDAIFDGLDNIQRMVLFLIDDYECATIEMQTWLCGSFLGRISRNPNFRVAIAGKEVPEADNIEWADCCETRELRGIPNAKDWVLLLDTNGALDTIGAEFGAVDPESWIIGLCHGLHGHPGLMMGVFKPLIRRAQGGSRG